MCAREQGDLALVEPFLQIARWRSIDVLSIGAGANSVFDDTYGVLHAGAHDQRIAGGTDSRRALTGDIVGPAPDDVAIEVGIERVANSIWLDGQIAAGNEPMVGDCPQRIHTAASVSDEIGLRVRGHDDAAPGQSAHVDFARNGIFVQGREINTIFARLGEADRLIVQTKVAEAICFAGNGVRYHSAGIRVGVVGDGQVETGRQAGIELDGRIEGIANGQRCAGKDTGIDIQGFGNPNVIRTPTLVAVTPDIFHSSGHRHDMVSVAVKAKLVGARRRHQ